MVNVIEEVRHLISSVDFPIGKDDLVEVAKAKGVPRQLVDILENFPDREYRDGSEVTEEAVKQTGLGGLGNLLR